MKNLCKAILFISVQTSLLCAAQSIDEAFTKAHFDGEFRIVHYSRSSDKSPIFPKAAGQTIGGDLGFTTQSYKNLKASARLYTAQKLFVDDRFTPSTYLLDGTKSFSILGEANLAYDTKAHHIKIGRQSIRTPLVSSDDSRSIKDLFDAQVYENRSFKKTTLSLIHLNSSSGMDNGSGNYNSAVSRSDFVSMSKTLGTSYDDGMFALGIKSQSIKDVGFKLWYYDMPKTLSMLYADFDYHASLYGHPLILEGHAWQITSKTAYTQDTGKKIDYLYSGFRLNYLFRRHVFHIAKEQIDYQAGTHGIHTAWGMYSEYTYGFLMGSGIYGALNGFNGMEIRRVDAIKAAWIYKFNQKTLLYVSYNWWLSDNDALQSNLKAFDLLLSWPCKKLKNSNWQLVYENWESQSQNIMVDNNLLRLTFTYRFTHGV